MNAQIMIAAQAKAEAQAVCTGLATGLVVSETLLMGVAVSASCGGVVLAVGDAGVVEAANNTQAVGGRRDSASYLEGVVNAFKFGLRA